jgi:hypothetical protein
MPAALVSGSNASAAEPPDLAGDMVTFEAKLFEVIGLADAGALVNDESDYKKPKLKFDKGRAPKVLAGADGHHLFYSGAVGLHQVLHVFQWPDGVPLTDLTEEHRNKVRHAKVIAVRLEDCPTKETPCCTAKLLARARADHDRSTQQLIKADTLHLCSDSSDAPIHICLRDRCEGAPDWRLLGHAVLGKLQVPPPERQLHFVLSLEGLEAAKAKPRSTPSRKAKEITSAGEPQNANAGNRAQRQKPTASTPKVKETTTPKTPKKQKNKRQEEPTKTPGEESTGEDFLEPTGAHQTTKRPRRASVVSNLQASIPPPAEDTPIAELRFMLRQAEERCQKANETIDNKKKKIENLKDRNKQLMDKLLETKLLAAVQQQPPPAAVQQLLPPAAVQQQLTAGQQRSHLPSSPLGRPGGRYEEEDYRMGYAPRGQRYSHPYDGRDRPPPRYQDHRPYHHPSYGWRDDYGYNGP